MRKFICNLCGNREPCLFCCDYDELIDADLIRCPGKIAIADFVETDDAREP